MNENKITKGRLKEIINEELKNANSLMNKLINEGNLFKNTNRLLPDEWEKFKKKYLQENRGYIVKVGKLQSGNKFEAIVDKSSPKKAIVKYIADDFLLQHNMKSTELYDYIR